MYLKIFKGTLPQNIFMIKTGHIGYINFFNIGGLNKFFLKLGITCNLGYFLIPKTIFLLHVQSKVWKAPIHVRSKVCKFAPHMDGSIADFAPHMEGRPADFAPHMEQRHSFRDQIITNTAIFLNCLT